MNRKLTKFLALLLVALSLAPLLIACKDGDSGGTTDTSGTEENDNRLAFGQEDNGDLDMRILATTLYEYEFAAEEQSGDILVQAIYERNMAVEEYLGVNIEYIYREGGWNEQNDMNFHLQQIMSTNDPYYDAVVLPCSYGVKNILNGWYLNYDELEYLNLDNPWWIADMVEKYSVYDLLYCFVGDGLLSLYKSAAVMYFNKNMVTDNNLESPYDMVDNNTWTLDNFMKYAVQLKQDLNEDGKYDPGVDLMSYYGESNETGFLPVAWEIDVMKRVDANTFEIPELSDKFVTAFDKWKEFITGNEATYTYNTHNDILDNRVAEAFESSLTFIMAHSLEATEKLRDMTDDYGIVPMPKYDESQQNFVTQIQGTVISVPWTVSNPALSSKVLEAMACFSSDIVVEPYYERVLKTKYASDPTVRRMLDIIRQSSTHDISQYYNSAVSTHNYWFRFDNYRVDGYIRNCSSKFRSERGNFRASLKEFQDAMKKLSDDRNNR